MMAVYDVCGAGVPAFATHDLLFQVHLAGDVVSPSFLLSPWSIVLSLSSRPTLLPVSMSLRSTACVNLSL
jgi:hypothetical protein